MAGPDHTQEDIHQDTRLGHLEQDVRELRVKIETALQSEAAHADKISQHEDRLNFLDPLRALLDHIGAIKHVIDTMKRDK